MYIEPVPAATTPALAQVPALTLTALAELFDGKVWEAKRVYLNSFDGAAVYLVIDADGDVHVSIKGTRFALSGKKFQAIFDRIESRIDATFGERTLYSI